MRREHRALHRAQVAAAGELVAIYGELATRGANLLDDALAGKRPVVRRMYPAGGVHHASGADYYFHAHAGMAREYGHVHLFLRPQAMPAALAREGDAHLVAISLSNRGVPIGLFTTPWSFYAAHDTCALIDPFVAALPATSLFDRWLAAFVRLYRDDIAELIARRDRALASWRRRHPGRDPAKHVQIVTKRRISLERKLAEVTSTNSRARSDRRRRS